jgi:cyclic beta-1,2-glucan synthetase
VTVRYRSARYTIHVENPHGIMQGIASIEVDGMRVAAIGTVKLVDDAKTHSVRVVLGSAASRDGAG